MQSFDDFSEPNLPPPHNSPEKPVSIASLGDALAKAQGMIPAPTKNRTVDFTDKQGRRVFYKYADLADVIDCIREALSKNNLSVVHLLEFSGHQYGMRTKLIHSSGEALSTWYPLPNPLDREIRPQEFGSALTYARRYSLTALLGIASEEDDDGQAAPPVKPKPQAQGGPVIAPKTPITPNTQAPATPPTESKIELVTPAQIVRLFTIATEQGWTKEQIQLFMQARFNISSTKSLTRDQYDFLITTIETARYTAAMTQIVGKI